MGKGRKRKSGERYSSGDLKPLMTGAQWRRIKDVAVKMGADPRVATELGRLNMVQGEINSEQVATGMRIAAIYGAYERLHGVRRSSVSPSYEMGYGRSPDGDWDESIVERIESDMKRVQAHIPSFPPRIKAAIEELCVEDRAISPAELGTVRAILDKLAIHLNITKPRQAAAENNPARVRSWRDTHQTLASTACEIDA